MYSNLYLTWILFIFERHSLHRFNSILTRMKTPATWLLFATIFLLFACEKPMGDSDANLLSHPRVAMMSSLRSDLTTGNWSDYQTKWVQLNPSQKYQVWMEKLTETEALSRWNTAQRAKINAKKASLSESFFAQVHTDEQELAEYAEVLTVFSDTEIARIFMDVFPFDQVIDLGPIQRSCVCRWSIWCGVMSLCEYGGCTEVGGCGMWGMYLCKGLCDTPNGM
jgi:hypothetical protein